MHKWKQFHEKTAHRKAADLVVQATTHVHNFDRALDLGAGALADSRFLATKFSQVEAVDAQKPIDTAKTVKDSVTEIEFTLAKMQDFDLVPDSYDLVVARYSLPFMPKGDFLTVWDDIYCALVDGGVFVGQFFGVNDTWSSNSAMNFFTREEVELLIDKYDVVYQKESEVDGQTTLGEKKHWHVFNLILQKTSHQ